MSSTNQTTTPTIPDSLNQSILPLFSDAHYVAMSADPSYHVEPTLGYSERLEFCTRRQVNDLFDLIKSIDPSADLTITDIGEKRVLPPFRQLKYFNAGGLDDPRIYQVDGTIGDLQTTFEPGWLINVKHIIETPWATKLVLNKQFGGIYPGWQ